MSTPKVSKTDSIENSSQPAEPQQPAASKVAPKSSDRKSAEIATLQVDVDSFEGGDPYNRTGQFMVEQLRRVQAEK